MDNFKITEDRINNEIDGNGLPGSVLAQNHNEILKEILSKVGKYTGFPFKAKKIETIIPTGTFSWGGNSMDTTTNFDIKISKLTSDLNDIGKVLEILGAGTIIHFKDYIGRSAFFEFISFATGQDGSSNDFYTITLKGFADNPTYTFQDTEEQICVLDFYPKASSYTIDIVANELKLYENGVEIISKDLSIYLDDTNLSRITSGVLNGTTGIATFTRDDSSTFTIDLSNLIDSVPTNLSAFTNDGSDGNSSYVENDEITLASKVGLSIRDNNNIEKWKSDEFLSIKGVSFDIPNKRIEINPLSAFKVYVSNTIGNDSSGELNNEIKPFKTINSAITTTILEKGSLRNYEIIILDSYTGYEIIQPVVNLIYLHINSNSNTPNIRQRTSFALSEAFILQGELRYYVEPNASYTISIGGSNSMITLLDCKNVYIDCFKLHFLQDSPPTVVLRGIRFYSSTIFNKFRLKVHKSSQQYPNGEWVNDGYVDALITEQGDCTDVYFKNSTNPKSKNFIKSFTFTGAGTFKIASNCELEIGDTFVTSNGFIELDFSYSIKMVRSKMENTLFRGNGYLFPIRNNTLSGDCVVSFTANYNRLFYNTTNDAKFNGVPNNNAMGNILKDLRLVVKSDNDLRCQVGLIYFRDTDFPVSKMILDNVFIYFSQSNRDIFITGGRGNTFTTGGANGWTRELKTKCIVFRNGVIISGGQYLFNWVGAYDFQNGDFLSTENGNIEFDGLGISATANLKIRNTNETTFIY